MSKSIKLSPKHGVNPTIPVCFFCGEEKNEVALLGKIGGRNEDLEAPRHMVIDYEPCDKCRERWQQGVAIIEVATTPLSDGRPPIQENLYPTGRHIVIKTEAWNDIVDAEFKDGQMCLLEDKVFDQMFIFE